MGYFSEEATITITVSEEVVVEVVTEEVVGACDAVKVANSNIAMKTDYIIGSGVEFYPIAAASFDPSFCVQPINSIQITQIFSN